jgi:FkbM family methyltransferase
MYSQNDEEVILLQHLSSFTGTLLDIGANDGKTLSNSLALIERGWSAVLVEPAKTPFSKLSDLHKDNSRIQCVNLAIGTQNGELKFYSSGTHLNEGDTDLLSTLCESELSRWAGTDNEFTEETVSVVDFKTFLEHCNSKKFDLILIDAEGLDYDILTQINLDEVGCSTLVVETNSKDDAKYIEYCESFNFKPIHKTHENLIFSKIQTT